MENVINYDFKSSLSSDFSKLQQRCIIDIQQYQKSNLTESDIWHIKRKDSSYSWHDFQLTIQKLRCLICLSNCFSPRETADVLGISYQTLSAHLSELRYRFGFPSKKAMIAELRSSNFGQSIRILPTDIHRLSNLIKDKKSQKYLKH
jgi:DNA-binding CsgD family transcriptional regulator